MAENDESTSASKYSKSEIEKYRQFMKDREAANEKSEAEALKDKLKMYAKSATFQYGLRPAARVAAGWGLGWVANQYQGTTFKNSPGNAVFAILKMVNATGITDRVVDNAILGDLEQSASVETQSQVAQVGKPRTPATSTHNDEHAAAQNNNQLAMQRINSERGVA